MKFLIRAKNFIKSNSDCMGYCGLDCRQFGFCSSKKRVI